MNQIKLEEKMIKYKQKAILKINWFEKVGNKYVRDDWYLIEFWGNIDWYTILNSYWFVIYCKDGFELIGQLSLRGIINRLF